MAHLYFRFGTMGSGKSYDLYKVYRNYTDQNRDVLVFVSDIDNRHGIGKVTSRSGSSLDAITLYPESDIFSIVKSAMPRPSCILVDEGQFLLPDQVIQFSDVVDTLDIPVIVYGLKNNSDNKLFQGSEFLLLYADKIEEIKTICKHCESKATMVLRLGHDKKPVFNVPMIQVGNESYEPVCRKCWSKAYFKWQEETS